MFHKTSTKITIGIVAITTIVISFVGFFSIFRAQDEFEQTIHQYSVFRDDDRFIIKSIPNSPPPFPRIQQNFNEKVSNAVLISTVIGILLSVFGGFLFSRLITRPLNHLKDGIQRLRSTDEKVILSKTGEEEFDIVIDEFNDLVKELSYQEELRSNLVSDVAHELKTPITALMGQIQGVKDKVLELDDNRIDMLLKEMSRLNSLIETLNEYTRIKTSLPNLKLKEVNLKEIIEHIKEAHISLLKEKGIEMEIEVADNYKVMADEALLERLMVNLIENAIAHSKATKIKVSAKKNEINIADNGVGVEKEHLSRLFERFYRIEKSRSRKTGGLGLGLAMVKEIANAHNWKVKVKSEGKDMGTVFTIIIPASE